MKAVVVYEDLKDKELIELVKFNTPFFIEYIDVNTRNGLKESYKIKCKYSARKNPFVVVYTNKDKFVTCFWTESGSNAIQQFINYINNDCKN